MRKYFILTVTFCLLLLTCSKKSTGPDEPEPSVRTPFEIAYTADPIRSVSQLVSAAAGGSLEAYDQDSVLFELSIPPHALPSDTTITITPFSFLRIGGPGGDSCPACTGTDSLCCYHGALFEPSGLILDSPAVLTVHLAPGMPFPFPHGGLIVYLDSAAGSYEPCFTTYDTAAGRLQAEITHFSGYGTDDERYDRFEEAIYQAGEELSASVGTWSFYINLHPLALLRSVCDGCDFPNLPLNTCFPDLIAAVEKIVLDNYSRHAALVRGKAALQEPCDGLMDLSMCMANIDPLFMLQRWNNEAAFGPIKDALITDWAALVYKTGNEGHRLCEADSCDEGLELLSCAHNQIAHDPWGELFTFDPEFLANLNNWMLACLQCGIDVSIYADKEIVHKIALSAADAENCIVRYSVGVHNNKTNEPVEGVDVDLIELTGPVGTRYIGSGRTDSDGHCEVIYKGSDFGADCMLEQSNHVFAGVTFASKRYYSDTMSVVFKPLRVATSIDFHFHHKVEGLEGYYEEATASITGTVTGPACGYFDPSHWEGGFLRSWTCVYEYPFQHISQVGRLISPPLVLAPIADFFADSVVSVPGTSITVRALSSIYVHMGSLQELVAAEFSGSSNGTSYCDTVLERVFGCGDHYFCTPVAEIYPPFLPINGSFEPFRWTKDTLGNTATQTVTVEPIF